jgi:adenosine deaminase
VLRCGAAGQDAGCQVEVRWLYQVGRGRPPAQVFAQILTGFELAQADPRVVGFNLVMPEDGLVSMRDFTLQMQMIDYLHSIYPRVRIALHAGELSPGLVPPEGMRFHIRQSVELGHASRIGHGVDVMWEDRPHELMREMAERGVMVEIALTSNDVILGIRGRDHPLAVYRAAGVPVALATDDQGVARSEMPREYQKAVEEQGLDYAALKEMARTSLRHAFVQGDEVWREGRGFVPVAECASGAGGWEGARCTALVSRSPRARLQRNLELAFRDFEARWAAMPRP